MKPEFYRERLVAVTGATGINGSYIVKALKDAGAKSEGHIPHQTTKRVGGVPVEMGVPSSWVRDNILRTNKEAA